MGHFYHVESIQGDSYNDDDYDDDDNDDYDNHHNDNTSLLDGSLLLCGKHSG